MSIAKKFRLLSIGTSAAVFALLVLLGLTVAAESALNSAHRNREDLYRLSVLLRQTSDDLTRFARAYVVTGDSQWEREYSHLDAVQSGRAPWPDGRQISMRQMLRDAGLSGDELAKLDEADAKSNQLVATERAAFNALKGLFDDGSGRFVRQSTPNPEMARRLVHDQRYEAAREEINRPVSEFEGLLNARTNRLVDTALARSRVCLSMTGLLALLTGVLLFLTLRNAGSILRRTADQLERGAQELSSAAAQVSSVSQTLAQGASEQAASLEETSSSAEEVRAVAQSNAQHAGAAAGLVADSDRIGQRVDTQFRALSTSMSEIAESSRQISNIIRTVDEIAFQTNILALNAAVEAARAGDAGLGFAVVADEVRNLAQRAAQAAKETGVLIERAMTTTSGGARNLGELTSALADSRGNGQRIAELIRDVSSGSQQQAIGIDGIANAVVQMQQLTQRTAATAEECAASGEEMSSQTEAVLRLASDLRQAIG